jgi:hypothetical protein
MLGGRSAWNFLPRGAMVRFAAHCLLCRCHAQMGDNPKDRRPSRDDLLAFEVQLPL